MSRRGRAAPATEPRPERGDSGRVAGVGVARAPPTSHRRERVSDRAQARPGVLATVPVCLRAPAEGEALLQCLVSLWRTAAADLDVVVVDAGSPAADLAAQLGPVC